MALARRILGKPATRLALAVLLTVAVLIASGIAGDMTGSMLWADGAGALVAAGAVLLLDCGAARLPLSASALAPARSPAHIGAGLLIGAGLMALIVGALAAAGWYRVAAVTPDAGALAADLWLFLIVALFEELLFRGVIFRQLEGALGSWAALALSGALFGAAHAANPAATPLSTAAIAIGAGALLGGAYMLTRDVWLAVGLHWAWNFFEGPVFGTAVSGFRTSRLLASETVGPELWTGGEFGPEAGLVALTVTVAASVVLLVLAVRRGGAYTPAWLLRLIGRGGSDGDRVTG